MAATGSARGTGAIAASLAFLAMPAAGHAGSQEARADDGGAAPVVEVTRSIRVYARPRARRAARRGKVAGGARFRVYDRASGEGCRTDWLRIGPRAWICSRSTRPSDEPPTRGTYPRRRPGSALPYPYLVTSDAAVFDSLDDAVRGGHPDIIGGVGGFIEKRTARRSGERFFKTPRGWVAAPDVERIDPTRFEGVSLTPADEGRAMAFVVRSRARLYDRRGRERSGAGLPRLSFLRHLGPPVRRRGMALHAIDGERFVRDDDISRLVFAEPPRGVSDHEPWLDVSLARQVLIAYRGRRPVFATLVSTGRSSTPAGLFRIKKKRATGRLRSLPGSERQWDVHVPWVMTLHGRIAMHVAYWHDNFGRAYSAGCINLSPSDAKWVWDFTSPTLPPGWIRVRGDRATPGTVVRIRD